MKKTIFILNLITLLISIPTFGQFNFGQPKDSTDFVVKIEPDFFLLGTFSDYMGRFEYVDRKTQIDRYYPYEEPLANYMVKFINQHYDTKVEAKISESRNSEIFSTKLANQIHSEYFDEKGGFINTKLDTEEKKYSFLVGVYYRYGEHLEGNIYKIDVTNSPKDKEIYQILKDLECDKMVYKFLRDYIPSSDIFYFVATPRMIKYFNIVKREKEELQKSYYNNYLGKQFEGVQGKEFKEKYDARQEEFIKSLNLIFR